MLKYLTLSNNIIHLIMTLYVQYNDILELGKAGNKLKEAVRTSWKIFPKIIFLKTLDILKNI